MRAVVGRQPQVNWRHPGTVFAVAGRRAPTFEELLHVLDLVPFHEVGDPGRLQQFNVRRTRAVELLESVFHVGPLNLGDFIERLHEVVAADEEFLTIVKDLQTRLLSALDGMGADTSADTTKIRDTLPKDSRVLKLFIEIGANSDPDMSEAAIAADFVAQHGGNADTLLRGVRRYRERLRNAKLI